MILRNILFAFVSATYLAGAVTAADTGVNLFAESPNRKIVVLVSNRADELEQYAASELVRHVERVTGAKPEIVRVGHESGDSLSADANLLILGRADEHRVLKRLADAGFYEASLESITDPAELRATMPIISGVGRYGHTLSLQWLAAKGAALVGRITGVEGSTLTLDGSVADCIRFGDRRSQEVE